MYHLTFATEGRGAMFPSEAARRSALLAIAATCGPALLLHCLVDDHVHLLLYCDPARIGVLSRSVLRTLRARAAAPIAPGWPRHADTRSYQLWLVHYLLDQPRKHGLGQHPALWSGSAFQDLAGARVLPHYQPPFAEALPRWRRREAFVHVGLNPDPLQLLNDAGVLRLGLSRLVEAAASACCADPALTGRAPEVLAARRVAAQVAGQVGWTTSQISASLGVPPRTARRLTTAPADDALIAATRRRLALEERVASLPASTAKRVTAAAPPT